SGLYKAMVADLEGVTPARGLRFGIRRGLFGKVDCTVKYFVEHGAALFTAAPITAVELKQLAHTNFSKLVHCPHLSRARALKFDASSTPAEVLAPLLHVAPLGKLRGLHVDARVIDPTTDEWHHRADPIANRVAAEPRLASLRCVSL